MLQSSIEKQMILYVLFSLMFLIPAAAVESNTWIAQSSVDRMNDEKTSAVYKIAFEVIYSPHLQKPQTNKVGALAFACTGKRYGAKIILRNTLMAGGRHDFTYRFDKNPPVNSNKWEASDDRSELELQDKAALQAFAKNVGKSKTLLIRVSDNVFGDTEMSFDLDGFEAAYAPVKSACKL